MSGKVKNFFVWIFVVFCLIMAIGMGSSGGLMGCLLMIFTAIISLPVKKVRDLWDRLFGIELIEELKDEKPAKFWQVKKKKEQKKRLERIKRRKSNFKILKTIIICVFFFVSMGLGISATSIGTSSDHTSSSLIENDSEENSEDVAEASSEETEATTSEETSKTSSEEAATEGNIQTVSLDNIPEYSGSPYVVINDNIPYFTDDEIVDESYESYSSLDSLGRCGVAVASIGQDLMPTEEKGSISSVKPTGWHSVTYDIVDGNYLYNRCHLIGYQLTGENANEKNLITGTRYMNVDGMLPFENMVADYIRETGNHVMYRVTPIFSGNNLVADGVLMEAVSVEDDGDGILFNVFCYNVQPGITIDYATGDSCLSDGTAYAENSETEGTTETATTEKQQNAQSASTEASKESTYILNTNTKKFHKPSCSSVKQMSDKNKQEYTGVRDDLIEQGYSPCGNCNP